MNIKYLDDMSELEDSNEDLIEQATYFLAMESLQIYDDEMFDNMYEWLYDVKDADSKIEDLHYDYSKKVIDMCDDILAGAMKDFIWIRSNK